MIGKILLTCIIISFALVALIKVMGGTGAPFRSQTTFEYILASLLAVDFIAIIILAIIYVWL